MNKDFAPDFNAARSLQSRRNTVAERQRLAGVALADWLRLNAKGSSSIEQSANIQHYIAVEIERIDRCTQELLQIDEEIERKTAGMSQQMKNLVIYEGAIY